MIRLNHRRSFTRSVFNSQSSSLFHTHLRVYLLSFSAVAAVNSTLKYFGGRPSLHGSCLLTSICGRFCSLKQTPASVLHLTDPSRQQRTIPRRTSNSASFLSRASYLPLQLEIAVVRSFISAEASRCCAKQHGYHQSRPTTSADPHANQLTSAIHLASSVSLVLVRDLLYVHHLSTE